MRPKRFTYTFAALDADGYVASANINSVAVGAGYTIRAAATHPNDGCSHPVTITSGGDATGTVFTITGVDAEGRTISEDITGGSTTVVTSVKYYADVTSVVRKSGATGAVAITVGYTAVAKTPIYPVNPYAQNPPSIGTDIGGTIDYTVQETNGNVYSVADDDLYWAAVSAGMTGASTDQFGLAANGITGVRVLINSHTSGTLALTLAQG